MAEEANIIVTNLFTEPITISRKLPGGNFDLNIIVAHGNQGSILLSGTDVSLIINAPPGVDTQYSPVIVKSSIIDLAVLCSQPDSGWTVRILANRLPPEVPTTVNITVGADGP